MTAGIITALVDGYQYGTEGVNDKSVVLSAKHFPGDGAAENGFESHTYQGQWRLYPTEGSLEKYQLVGFQAAIDAGVGAIMPCYSRDTTDSRSVTQTYRGHEVKVNELGSAYNAEIIDTLLRDIMGFEGFVNSDSGITNAQTYGVETLTGIERYALLIEAGTDAIGGELAPEYIVSAVEFGLLDKADLDRATFFSPERTLSEWNSRYRQKARNPALNNAPRRNRGSLHYSGHRQNTRDNSLPDRHGFWCNGCDECSDL